MTEKYTKAFYNTLPITEKLSHVAVALWFRLLIEHNNKNNGSIKITKHLGGKWTSNSTREKARDELVQAGLLVLMFQGHRPHKASLYALVGFPLSPNKQRDPGAEEAFRCAENSLKSREMASKWQQAGGEE